MSVVTYDLGELEHIFAKRHLKLRTHSSLTLSSLDASQRHFLNNCYHLQDLVCTRAWISSGQSFKINFNFSYDDITIGDINISENLGTVLREAELWSQLCLIPSLSIPVELENRPMPSAQLCLTLTPSHGANRSQIRTLEPHLPHHSNLPTGVSVIIVEAIDLYIEISRCPQIIRSMGKKERVRNSSGLAGASIVQSTEHNEERHHSRFVLNHVASLNPSLEVETQGLQMLGNELEENIYRTGPQVLKFKTPFISQSTAFSQPSADLLSEDLYLTSPKNCHERRPTQSITLAELTKLLDCSLRGMIFTPKRRKSLGSSTECLLSSMTDDPKLGQISPAIFSPGYLQAVSERMPFMPTLTGTIIGIDVHAKSASLQQSLQRLRKIPFHHCSHGQDSTYPNLNPNGQPVSDAAGTRLWILLKQTLYHEDACSKLKPLKMSHGTMIDDVDSEYMLDVATTQADEDSVEPAYLNQNAEESRDALEPIAQLEDSGVSTQGLLNDLLNRDADFAEEPFSVLDRAHETSFTEYPQSEENLFQSLEAEGEISYEQQDEDLWTDFDEDDLLDETPTSSWVTHDHKTMLLAEDELLDDTQHVVPSSHSQSGDWEDAWTEGLDFSFDESSVGLRRPTSLSYDHFEDLEGVWLEHSNTAVDKPSQDGGLPEPEMLL